MTCAWEAAAAYFYVLSLDRSLLAWEYLRRNQEYRDDWKQRKRHPDAAAKWRCISFEDPSIDARFATPQWLDESPELVTITRTHEAQLHYHPFSVWGVGGQRVLSHDGAHVYLRSRAVNNVTVRMDATLSDGDPYTFVVRADGLLRERLRLAQHVSDHIQHRGTRINLAKQRSVLRTSLNHARTLQVLDGVHAGASHRELAIALFGVTAVQERWSADSELRAQIRFLLRKGHGLVKGGYRQLLLGTTSSEQGEL